MNSFWKEIKEKWAPLVEKIMGDDGKEYLDMGVKSVLVNLIYEGKILPIAAIFIETVDDRDTELKCNEDFAHFIIKEVIPW
ncbi:hypothetical protein JK636_03220 [Clostridium sp. YIM B02515]|uniref:Uncharacterized protein n=1 Tax=Clostridium rhizosphaerae TaxID=2803861 RepID=A0ABS1T688_9CLOT|nr:hypothetical protein [Clostridium rhizosphaerae]MBL4934766.1 hypothetical protein [Clostridium rhizosphaerae]